jgi:glycosyltransferase involved in cell wall biosynthesis
VRIALDATPLLGAPTGVGAFVGGALEGLSRRDDVSLSAYALSFRGGRGLPAALPGGVRPLTRPMAAGPLLWCWRRAPWPPATWWTGDADVVHGTNFTVPPTRRGRGAVVTVHDLTPLRYPHLASGATRHFPRLVRRAVERGAWVHTPSRFVAGEVVEHLDADPDLVRAVHHGVPPVPEASGPAPVHGRYVLALGTVEPRKGLPALVRAFDAVAGEHEGVRLVVAGPDGWGVRPFEEAVLAAKHADRIVRLGWVDGAHRAALLRGAAVYAYPSLYEGFGFPPLEAMACGVPVVATRAGSLPEVLGDAALLAPPGDAAAMAEALDRALGDEPLRADLAARGRRHAAGFTWDACAAGLADLYRLAAAE